MTAVMEAEFGKRRLLMIFQDGCEKDLTLNQLNVVAVDRIVVAKESKVPIISTKPEEVVDLMKVYYPGAYVFLEFNKEYGAHTEE